MKRTLVMDSRRKTSTARWKQPPSSWPTSIKDPNKCSGFIVIQVDDEFSRKRIVGTPEHQQ